jgi:hypothetical protein
MDAGDSGMHEASNDQPIVPPAKRPLLPMSDVDISSLNNVPNFVREFVVQPASLDMVRTESSQYTNQENMKHVCKKYQYTTNQTLQKSSAND